MDEPSAAMDVLVQALATHHVLCKHLAQLLDTKAQEEFSGVLFQIAQRSGTIVPLARELLDLEFSKKLGGEETSILRGSSLCTKFIALLAQEPAGARYVRETLSPLVRSVVAAGNDEDGGSDDAVIGYLSQLLTVLSSQAHLDSIPRPMRAITAALAEKADLLVPARKWGLVAGYLCLRVYNPALTAPHAFGLLRENEPLPASARQRLLVITKALQHLSNGTPWRDGPQLARWLEEAQPRIQSFLQSVIEDDESDPPFADCFQQAWHVSSNELDPSIRRDLMRIMMDSYAGLKAVRKRLIASGATSLVEVYDQILAALRPGRASDTGPALPPPRAETPSKSSSGPALPPPRAETPSKSSSPNVVVSVSSPHVAAWKAVRGSVIKAPSRAAPAPPPRSSTAPTSSPTARVLTAAASGGTSSVASVTTVAVVAEKEEEDDDLLRSTELYSLDGVDDDTASVALKLSPTLVEKPTMLLDANVAGHFHQGLDVDDDSQNGDRRSSDSTNPEESVDTVKTPLLEHRPRKQRGVNSQPFRLSQQLRRLSDTPQKFRISTGVFSSARESVLAAPPSSNLEGWILLQKKDSSFRWKRYYVEVEPGCVRISVSESPKNIDLLSVRELGFRVSYANQASPTVHLLSGTKSLLQLRASPLLARALCERIMVIGEGSVLGEGSDDLMGTVTLVGENDEREHVLTWTGSILTTFLKRYKRSVSLRALDIVVTERADAAVGECAQQLSITNADGETLLMTCPDRMLLLKWVDAITSCDSEPKQRDVNRGTVVGAAVAVMFVEEAKRETRASRSTSLGVSSMLGIDKDAAPIPTREAVKAAMMDAQTFPSAVPTLSYMLSSSPMREWLYQWALTQHSGENVKFWVACENLKGLLGVKERAEGILHLASVYVASSGEFCVNIGGLLRKRLLKRVADAQAKGEDALASLVPSILQDPQAEIFRVIQFDIFPTFALLCKEVISERSRPDDTASITSASPPMSPKSSAKTSIRDLLTNESAMQDLLLGSAGKDQDALLFLTLVQKFRAVSGVERRNMGMFLARKYLDAASPNALEGILSLRKVVVPSASSVQSPTAFDAVEAEVIAYLDGSELFKRHLKVSKTASTPTRMTMSRKLGEKFKLSSLGRSAGRDVANDLQDKN